MDLSLSILFVLAVILGLGEWLPARFPGLRFAVGGAAIPLVMQTGAVVFGFPLSWLGWALVVVAFAGFVRRGHRIARAPASAMSTLSGLTHPIYVLPLLIAAVGLAFGDTVYVPYGQDEFTSWLYWPRQQYVADQVWRADMLWNITGYVQGWPLSIVFAQTPWSEFSGLRGISVAALWHVGVLGIAYDIVGEVSRRQVGFPAAQAAVLAWLVVLILLAGEAAWTLVPQLVQVEMPQVYFLSAGFAAAALVVNADRRESSVLALACGLLFAAAYTIKVANIAAAPGLLIIAALLVWREPSWATRVVGCAALLLPLIAVAISWSWLTPFAKVETCFTRLDQTLGTRIGDLVSADGRAIAGAMLRASIAYVSTYKLPLTLGAGLGVALGIRRHAAVVVGLFVFIAAYIAGLLPIYVFCLGPGSVAQPFDSLQRYLMVPLRVVHVTGLILLATSAIDIVAPRMGRIVAHHRAPLVGALAGTLLLAWQVAATYRAVGNLSTRYREDPQNVASMARLEQEAASLRSLLQKRAGDEPHIALVTQGRYGYESSMAYYLALGRKRGASLRTYRLYPAYSWGASARNMWMQATTPERLLVTFRGLDIIWPFEIDEWMRGVLTQLATDGNCTSFDISNYFLVRNNTTHTFDCVAKVNSAEKPRATW